MFVQSALALAAQVRQRQDALQLSGSVSRLSPSDFKKVLLSHLSFVSPPSSKCSKAAGRVCQNSDKRNPLASRRIDSPALRTRRILSFLWARQKDRLQQGRFSLTARTATQSNGSTLSRSSTIAWTALCLSKTAWTLPKMVEEGPQVHQLKDQLHSLQCEQQREDCLRIPQKMTTCLVISVYNRL